MRTMRTIFALGVALLLTAVAHAQDAGRPPEAATGFAARPLVTARQHMAVAAHPLAAEAGRQILRQGGSAVDAAIALQWPEGRYSGPVRDR